jgi:hypothetical protein
LTLMPPAMAAAIAGTPSAVAGILTSRVRPVDCHPEQSRRLDGGSRVTGQSRVHFDGHPAVDMPGGLIHLREGVAAGPDIISGDQKDRFVNAGAGFG